MNTTIKNQFWKQISQLWQMTKGNPDICVAVIDGPVDIAHPCFATANLEQTSIKPYNNGLATQHGTHVSSIIFGQHDSQIKGIAPKCKGIFIPIFSETANGQIQPSTQTNLARAINEAVERGANIINISAGEFSKTGESSIYLQKAIQHCEDNNVLIVSATGNNGCACLHVPASNANVLAVGAVDDKGVPMSFSNWGNAYKKNGILALGENIKGAAPNGGVIEKTGTSFATPLVSGVVALLLSLQKQNNPAIPPNIKDIKDALLKSTIPCDTDKQDCDKFLKGILNIEATLKHLNLENANQSESSLHLQELNEKKTYNKSVKSFKTTVQPKNLLNMNPVNEQVSNENGGNHIPVTATQEVANVLPQENAVTQSASPAVIAPLQTSVRPSEVTPSSCGCSSKGNLVFAIGSLWMDYPTQAVVDSFKFYMRGIRGADKQPIAYPNPYDPKQLLSYLNGQVKDGSPTQTEYEFNPHPYESERVTWILRQEELPIYAIRPARSFGEEAYALLRDFLQPFDDSNGGLAVDLVSIPGHIVGETKLFSGEVVPVIEPSIRAMFNWRSRDLVKSVLYSRASPFLKVDDYYAKPLETKGATSEVEKSKAELFKMLIDYAEGRHNPELKNLLKKYNIIDDDSKDDNSTDSDVQKVSSTINEYKVAIRSFIDKIYYEFRNLGTTSAERALNYTGTNIYWLADTFFTQIDKGFALQNIVVEKSAVCRPDSDCQDVSLTFFDPSNRLDKAPTVFKYTVDVSRVIPVSIGQPRSWRTY